MFLSVTYDFLDWASSFSFIDRLIFLIECCIFIYWPSTELPLGLQGSFRVSLQIEHSLEFYTSGYNVHILHYHNYSFSHSQEFSGLSLSLFLPSLNSCALFPLHVICPHWMVFRLYFDFCLLSLFHNSFCHENWYCISDLG